MGIKERQERERQSVRRSILEAARDLFVNEGYRHVSIRKIADRIEYSPAAIYGYFPSKDDIFFALAEEGFELLAAVDQTVPDSPDPLQGLKSRFWSVYRFSKEHPEHFALMFLDRDVPRIRSHYDRFPPLNVMKEGLIDLIRQCVRAGVLPPTVEPRAAFVLLGTVVLGAAIAGLCGRMASGEDADSLANDSLEIAIAGLRAGAPLTIRPHASPAEQAVCGSAAPEAEPPPEKGTLDCAIP